MMNTKKNHILIALHLYTAGGAERQALYLAKGLQDHGYAVSVIAFGEGKGLAWDRFQAVGIRCLALGFREKLILGEKKGIKENLLFWRYQRQLIKTIQKLRVDIILPFTYPANVIYGQSWQKMGAKACYWNQRDEGRWFSGSKIELKALENCTGIISNSLEGKLFLEQYTQRAIQIIHNGIELPIETAKPELVKDQFRVVMVANLHTYKDHLTLLKAWKLFVESKPENAKLLLAGKKADTYPMLQAFVDEHKLSDSVQFLGVVEDVYALLATCHLAVFSSNKEGLPNGILECMAVGLPVIATDINGAREALVESEFLVESGNFESLGAAILKFYLQAENRKTVGNLNRTRVKESFSISKMIAQYQSKIENV
ncbi:glycosyltransferase [Fulvivirgaceae bacterium LMO-SS25]